MFLSCPVLHLAVLGPVTTAAAFVPESSLPIPNDAVVEGQAAAEGGLLVSDGSYRLTLPAHPKDSLLIRGRAGKDPTGLQIEVQPFDAAVTRWTINAQDEIFEMGEKSPWWGVENPEKTTVADAYLQLPWGLKYFIRPNPAFYALKEQQELVARWDHLPPASGHIFTIELRAGQGGLEFWIDGRFVGALSPCEPQKILLSLGKGSGLREVKWTHRSDPDRFLTLPLGYYSRPGVMKNGRLSLASGPQTIGGIPMLIASPEESVDVGLSRLLITRGKNLDDPYYRRSAFDGTPETILFSVPKAQYVYAYLLCAVEASAEKVPLLAVRLTRYAPEGRGDAIADTLVVLPRRGEKPRPGIRQVGKVTYSTGGKALEAPLWLVRVPLNIGQIQDLLVSDREGMWQFKDHFDFELTRGLEQEGGGAKPTGPPSAVHVFGLTLEESPVTMICRSKQAGNIFYRAEKPAFQLHLTNHTGKRGRYQVQWTWRDLDGKQITDGQDIDLAANAQEQVVEIPAEPGEVGWYEASIRLLDVNHRLLIDHRTSFAILPPDTRRVGYESPFGTWWFRRSHGGTGDKDVVGPLFLRAGLRHTTLGPDRDSPSEQELAPYKVTAAYIPFRYGAYDESCEEWMKANERMISAMQEKYPHCDSAMIFHESSVPGLTFPPELYGGKPEKLTEEQEKLFRERLWDRAMALSRYYREKHPHLKIVFGNTGNSIALCSEFFRRKYPRELIDYLGVEMLGQTFMPEKLIEHGFQGAWFLRETAKLLGYQGLPLTACYEWIGRANRSLGLRTQAEWYMRDCLLALAYGFHRINPALLYDVSNDYFHSVWGATGLCYRNPVLSPKPSYVAMATLTQMLDGARFVRAIPTGSLSLYCLEFQTHHGTVYALWCVRGLREATWRFSADSRVTVTDLIGRQREVSTRRQEVVLTVSTGVQYLQASARLVGAVPGRSAFPDDRPPTKPALEHPMQATGGWQFVEEPDPRLERTKGDYSPFRTKGNMTVREVTDPERGKCLEVELLPGAELPDLFAEYGMLRPRNPIDIPGEPRSVGLWVKGNSGWGLVMWEVTDAEGERWLSCGRGGWGCDMLDWPGKISLNFDGWNFLQMDLPVPAGIEGYPYPFNSSNQSIRTWPQWHNAGGNGRVDYPIKLTGVVVEMRRKAVYLTDMVPVPDLRIRLKEVCAF